MNRLLPEILTMSTLHCVMSALDDGSYIVSEPLHMPPLRDRNDAVFESSKYPIVRVPPIVKPDGADGAEKDEVIDMLDESDDEMGGEEKKEDDDVMRNDPTVRGSTRESRTISAFTPKGFLKLIENTGNDISEVRKIHCCCACNDASFSKAVI